MSTVWIGPDGDDANPGTKEQPLATLRAAYATLPDGGTVRMHCGRYQFQTSDYPPRGVCVVGDGLARLDPWWRRALRRPRRATILERR